MVYIISVVTHMFEVASMGLHVAQMTSTEEMKQIFSAITENAAKVMNLPNYGIAEGCNADFIVLQTREPVEAIRLRSACLYVIRRGKVIAQSSPVQSHQLCLMATNTISTGCNTL